MDLRSLKTSSASLNRYRCGGDRGEEEEKREWNYDGELVFELGLITLSLPVYYEGFFIGLYLV